MSGFRTPLSRAKGMGAAGHGAGHWLSERVTSLALVPLVLWLVWAGLTIAGSDFETAVVFVHQPVNAVLLVLLLAVGFLHMHDGLRVVIEDYLEKTRTRVAALVFNLFICVLGGALAIFSVLKVALSGAW